MMRWLLLLISVILFLKLNAQKVTWSNARQLDDRNNYMVILGENKEGIYLIRMNYRNRRHNLILEQFSLDLKLIATKKIITNKNEELLNVYLNHKGVMVFYAADGKRIKDIKAKQLNFALEEEGKDTFLFTLPSSGFEARLFRITQPKMQSFFHFLYPENNNPDKLAWHTMVLDSSLKTLSSATLTLDVKAQDYSISQIAVSKTKLGLLVRTPATKSKSIHEDNYTLFTTDAQGNSLKKYELFNDSFITTAGGLLLDAQTNTLLFGGMYSLKDSTPTKGYYYFKEAENITKTYTPFTPKFIAEVEGKTHSENGLFNIDFRDCYLRDDGGLIITAEEYRYTREMATDMNFGGSVPQTSYRNYYYYNDVLAISLNPDGSTHWAAVLRKDQTSMNDEGIYSSIAVHSTPTQMHFLYNDVARKRWTLNSQTIGASGKFSPAILIQPQDYNGKLIIRDAAQVTRQHTIICGLTEAGYVLVRVEL